MIFQDLRFFPKKFSRKASYSESNKLIHSGQFVKIPFRTYVRLIDSLEYGLLDDEEREVKYFQGIGNFSLHYGT